MLLAQIDAEVARKIMTEQNYTVAGVVLAILIVVALAVWKVLSWTGTNVIIPARDRVFAHLDIVNSTMRDVSCSLGSLSTMPDRLDTIEGKVDHLQVRVDGIDTHLQKSPMTSVNARDP
jgi:hypothetical protein